MDGIQQCNNVYETGIRALQCPAPLYIYMTVNLHSNVRQGLLQLYPCLFKQLCVDVFSADKLTLCRCCDSEEQHTHTLHTCPIHSGHQSLCLFTHVDSIHCSLWAAKQGKSERAIAMKSHCINLCTNIIHTSNWGLAVVITLDENMVMVNYMFKYCRNLTSGILTGNDWNMAKQRFFIWSIWFWLGFAGTKYQLLCFGSWLEFAKWELNGGIELAIWS